MKTFNRGDVFISENDTYYVYIKHSLDYNASMFMSFALNYHALIDKYTFKQLEDVYLTSSEAIRLQFIYTFNVEEALRYELL